jgi:hypothetical protein
MRCLFLFAFLVLAPAAHADVWERTYKVGDRAALRLEADDAEVTVRTWDRAEIHVRVETSGIKIGSKEVTIEEQQTEGGVSVRVREERGMRISIRWEPNRVEIRVPRKAHLDLRTDDGSITVTGVSGTISAESGDGRIVAVDLDGQVHLSTDDGRIVGRGLRGEIAARTGDGRIQLDGVFTRLEVSSGDGSIDLEAARGSALEAPWSIRTEDGSVAVRLPAGLDANLDAHTDDGRVRLRTNGSLRGDVQRRLVRVQLGRGGQDLRIRSGEGSISITQ